MRNPMKLANEKFIRIICFGIAFLAFLVSAGPLEGRFWPVTDNYIVISQKVADNDLVLRVVFTKKRNCEFVSSQLYIYFDDNTSDRFFIKNDQSFTRPLGRFTVNWTVLNAAFYINHKMQFVTEHSCWGTLFWTTRMVHEMDGDTLEATP